MAQRFPFARNVLCLRFPRSIWQQVPAIFGFHFPFSLHFLLPTCAENIELHRRYNCQPVVDFQCDRAHLLFVCSDNAPSERTSDPLPRMRLDQNAALTLPLTGYALGLDLGDDGKLPVTPRRCDRAFTERVLAKPIKHHSETQMGVTHCLNTTRTEVAGMAGFTHATRQRSDVG